MCSFKLHTFTALLLVLICFLPAKSTAAGVRPCGDHSTTTGRTLRVTGSSVFLRTGPGLSFSKIVNQKLSKALGTTEYLTIDNSVTVYESCTDSTWSYITVTDPEWLRDTHKGWVPTEVLREPNVDSSGIESFTEDDFTWDSKTLPHKEIIIAGVNRVHRDNPMCKDIDPSTAYISSDKGTSKDPVFYVTCGKGVDAFNFFFSKSEVEGNKKFAPPPHIDHVQAIALCEAYAKAHAVHPSTVHFSRVMDLSIVEHPNGRTTVTSTFSAKNALNLKLKYGIRCLLDINGLIEGNIWEMN